MKGKSKKKLRMAGKFLFVLYICFLFYFLIFSDWYGRTGETGTYRYNLELFREIKRYWYSWEQLGWIAIQNLVGNVVIFAPFGFFMAMASRYKSFFLTVFYSFCLSFCVEIFQLLTKVGSFDVDDLLLNTIGGLLGYVFFAICNVLRRR